LVCWVTSNNTVLEKAFIEWANCSGVKDPFKTYLADRLITRTLEDLWEEFLSVERFRADETRWHLDFLRKAEELKLINKYFIFLFKS